MGPQWEPKLLANRRTIVEEQKKTRTFSGWWGCPFCVGVRSFALSIHSMELTVRLAVNNMAGMPLFAHAGREKLTPLLRRPFLCH